MQTVWACRQYLIDTAFVDVCPQCVAANKPWKRDFRWVSSPKLLTRSQSYKQFADEAHGGYNWRNMGVGTDFFYH